MRYWEEIKISSVKSKKASELKKCASKIQKTRKSFSTMENKSTQANEITQLIYDDRVLLPNMFAPPVPSMASNLNKDNFIFGTQHQSTYILPPNQFGLPPNQFGSPPNQFGSPPNQFGSPPNQFVSPANQFVSLPNQFISPANQFGSSSNQFCSPPNQFGSPPNVTSSYLAPVQRPVIQQYLPVAVPVTTHTIVRPTDTYTESVNPATLPNPTYNMFVDNVPPPAQFYKYPPELVPKPFWPSNVYVADGPPSTSSLTKKIDSASHRLTDYFQGMLKETLHDLSKLGSKEAQIRVLQLEVENLKYEHEKEVQELKKNTYALFKNIQKSIFEDTEKIIGETKARWKAETLKIVEEIKTKQWCAYCRKEAKFHCCWNTSYCDYVCQRKHWPTHMKVCTQVLGANSTATSSSVTE